MRNPVRLYADWQPERLGGSIVALARLDADVSVAELARRTSTSRALISDYERGAKQPSLAMIQRLLGGLGKELRLQIADSDPHDDDLEADARRAGWDGRAETRSAFG